VLANGGEYEREYRVLRPDGQVRWIVGRGHVESKDGRPIHVLGVSLDVTQRKLAEERSQLVVEATPNALVMVNPEGRITLVNAAVEKIFGYSRQELIGQPVEVLVPENLRGEHPGNRGGYLAHPEVRAMGAGRELFGRRKDGSEVPVEIGLNPIQTPDGMFVLAAVIDITQRQKAELDAERQRNELAHLSRVTMLGELSGSLAHELNQPLTSILSNAQAAQRFLAQGGNLDEVHEILKDIVKEDKQAGEIIRRLRLLLKKGEVHHEPLDIAETVRDVLRLVRSDLVNQGVTVTTEMARNLPAVGGDRVQLQQVLLNLVVNGCDAMADTPAVDRELVVRAERADGGGVQVSVSDNGSGIPDGQVERIFDPFFTTKAHGMGLGLAVCRTIITAHGGRLWAVSNNGQGATVHFSVPAADMFAGQAAS
jgi:two-component system sensor kinase FixL